MLNISLRELTGRARSKCSRTRAGLRVDERHHVLQLIAETEGAPRLVGCASRPKAARQRLVQEPSVGQHIEGLVGCFHLHGAERVRPVLPYRFKRLRAAADPRKRSTMI
jgi:hypothetical protein